MYFINQLKLQVSNVKQFKVMQMIELKSYAIKILILALLLTWMTSFYIKKQLIPDDAFETSTSLPLLSAQNDTYKATLDA